MLSDEQRRWLSSAPYDGTTGNPVLAWYASLYVGGHRLLVLSTCIYARACACVCVYVYARVCVRKLKEQEVESQEESEGSRERRRSTRSAESC